MEIVRVNYEQTKALLTKKCDLLEKMASVLLDKEVITYDEIRTLLGDPAPENDLPATPVEI